MAIPTLQSTELGQRSLKDRKRSQAEQRKDHGCGAVEPLRERYGRSVQVDSGWNALRIKDHCTSEYSGKHRSKVLGTTQAALSPDKYIDLVQPDIHRLAAEL